MDFHILLFIHLFIQVQVAKSVADLDVILKESDGKPVSTFDNYDSNLI